MSNVISINEIKDIISYPRKTLKENYGMFLTVSMYEEVLHMCKIKIAEEFFSLSKEKVVFKLKINGKRIMCLINTVTGKILSFLKIEDLFNTKAKIKQNKLRYKAKERLPRMTPYIRNLEKSAHLKEAA
jgi:hypothetical protein